MIVTVTANTTLDQSIFIKSFIPNSVIRPHQTVFSMGGKPADASFILGQHGIPSLALGFAAGPTGEKVKKLLIERGVEVEFVEADGETRTAIALVAEEDGTETTITPNTLSVRPQHIDQLREKLKAVLPKASVMVTGGSLPNGVEPSFYTEFVGMAREYNVPVALDAKPENLRAGLQSQPAYIKPNQVEMSGLVGKPIKTPQDAYDAGRQIYDEYGTASVISLGGEGALAVLPDRAYRIPRIEIDVVSAVGAVDAVLAGIAYAIHNNVPIEEGLRFGIATATAVCLHPGTAMFHMEDAQRFMEQVELIPFH